MSELLHFIALLRPASEGALEHLSETEEDLFGQHFTYIDNLVEEHVLLLAGPCTDGAFSVVVFEATSAEHARALMEADPAVAGGILTLELHPFRVALLGG